MAMLMDVSRSISDISPNRMALDTVKLKLPAFGSRHITITATIAPPISQGRRRPKRFHVRSLSIPTIGCTISPINGGRIQK